MRFLRLPSFLRDWRALSHTEQELVRQWLRSDFLPVVAAYEVDPDNFRWPKSLRFEHITGGGGICAVTWSFSGSDGRATFEFDTLDGQMVLVWRRIGHHDVYRQP